MSMGKKIFLWAVLPLLIVMSIAEAVWAEVYRLVTDSKLLSVLDENYQKLKQIYTEDIWK